MLLRKAIATDIPAIIELLKTSLGERMTSKSEQLWSWKHQANPFGASPVLVAQEERGELIGVRAFLRWEFIKGGKLIKACRAVDTAVHPAYQGKGVFRQTTMELVEKMQAEGIDLIYNTPNTQSTPGYLKMGWEKWGKLPLKMEFNFNLGKKKKDPKPANWQKIREFIDRIETAPNLKSGVSTHHRPGYISWRYELCPLFPYHYLSDGESYLLIYRLKEGKLGLELRITDLFILGEITSAKKAALSQELKIVQKESGVRFTSFSGLTYPEQKAFDLGYLPVFAIGPIVTLRPLNDDFNPLVEDWKWSLGDLEVF